MTKIKIRKVLFMCIGAVGMVFLSFGANAGTNGGGTYTVPLFCLCIGSDQDMADLVATCDEEVEGDVVRTRVRAPRTGERFPIPLVIGVACDSFINGVASCTSSLYEKIPTEPQACIAESLSEINL